MHGLFGLMYCARLGLSRARSPCLQEDTFFIEVLFLINWQNQASCRLNLQPYGSGPDAKYPNWLELVLTRHLEYV